MTDGGNLNSTPLNRVVCAANRHRSTGIIIAGARHYDQIMRSVILAINGTVEAAREAGFYSCEEGFITNTGEFLTREQAAMLAERADQRMRVTGDKARLYSEDIY